MTTTPRTLVAIPVYNEEQYIPRVIPRVLEFASDVLVIDDGSTDRTPMLLAEHPVEVVRHAANRGYGHSLQDAFRWAHVDGFDWVITMDCDEQHEPEALPRFHEVIASGEADIISGSRYLDALKAQHDPPANRRAINRLITDELNERLGLSITDAFCGFKAYRVSQLDKLDLSEDGYAFPMQFWVQAVANGMRIAEIPVELIYNDPSRTFGGPLDDDDVRLHHYRGVLHAELCRHAAKLPAGAADNLVEHTAAACACPGNDRD